MILEDLKSLYKDILRDRDRSEDYSDRQQLNTIGNSNFENFKKETRMNDMKFTTGDYMSDVEKKNLGDETYK